MPLFFFLSGYFFKQKSFVNECIYEFRRLLIPYFATILAAFCIAFIFLDHFEIKENSLQVLYSGFWGNAIWGNFDFCSKGLYIGPLWFLWALFFNRLFTNLLYNFKANDKLICIAAVAIALLSAYLQKIDGALPLSFYASMGTFGFFWCGILIRRCNLLANAKTNKFIPFGVICWLYCISFSKLRLHENLYNAFYIIDLFGALAICLLLYHLVSYFYQENNYFWKFILFVGRYSLIMLCAHALDHCFLVKWNNFWFSENFIDYRGAIPFIRIAFAFAITYLISKNKFICSKIFGIKK